MSSYKNSRKVSFLQSIPTCSLDDPNQDMAKRCKFNFSYFDNSQAAGQDFNDWTKEQIVKLLGKLKEYSRESIDHWTNTKIGSGKHKYNVLEEYGSFPRTSDFIHPKHVPHQASWARFRIDQSVRLIGFRIPEEYKNKFDRNTFYIVFLDKDHRFYKTSR
ncbi:MAG: hypothetical protein L3J12_01585 [Spirochaetales bacterium]|nr:hypothetical protein [Spirochaetales bacterium]